MWAVRFVGSSRALGQGPSLSANGDPDPGRIDAVCEETGPDREDAPKPEPHSLGDGARVACDPSNHDPHAPVFPEKGQLLEERCPRSRTQLPFLCGEEDPLLHERRSVGLEPVVASEHEPVEELGTVRRFPRSPDLRVRGLNPPGPDLTFRDQLLRARRCPRGFPTRSPPSARDPVLHETPPPQSSGTTNQAVRSFRMGLLAAGRNRSRG
jgi:hypothetical protein